jgi:hypothetical protein
MLQYNIVSYAVGHERAIDPLFLYILFILLYFNGVIGSVVYYIKVTICACCSWEITLNIWLDVSSGNLWECKEIWEVNSTKVYMKMIRLHVNFQRVLHMCRVIYKFGTLSEISVEPSQLTQFWQIPRHRTLLITCSRHV